MPEPKAEGDSKASPVPEAIDSKSTESAETKKTEKSNSQVTPIKEEKVKDTPEDCKKESASEQPGQPIPIGAIGAATSGSSTGEKPATAVFVGGISDRAPNSMMRELLSVCGFVNNWKRVTGADGKLQSFGFCEFADPVATMTCGRLLGQVDVAGKKFIVRVDSGSQAMLDDYKKKHGLPDAPDAERDEDIKRRMTQIVQRFLPEIERVEDGELDVRAPKLVGPKQSLDDMDLDNDKRDIINREIEIFRSRYRDDSPKLEERLERERERERERRRREKREKERERDREKEREERSKNEGSSSKARSATAASEKATAEADEEAAERRRQEKKLLDKEESYQKELKHWNQREKKKAREYEREREREEKRLAKEAHEAREMRNFLAEYDDELDDAKFYKGDAFRRRLRERDREREQDERDRARELEEVGEARRRLLAEGREPADVDAICAELDEARDAHLRKLLSPPTPPPVQQLKSTQSNHNDEHRDVDNVDNAAGAYSVAVNGEGDNAKSRSDEQHRNDAHNNRSQDDQHYNDDRRRANDHDDDDNDDDAMMGGDHDDDEDRNPPPPPPPPPPSQQQQQQQQQQHSTQTRPATAHPSSSATYAFANEEEKKALIKRLIDGIPTAKDELFAYNLDWSIVDSALMENRVKPWINKKIIEYIGEEEAQLTEFVCGKVMDQTKPGDILGEMVLVLDDEAEVFVVKLWRLLIYETEAKKAGLVK